MVHPLGSRYSREHPQTHKRELIDIASYLRVCSMNLLICLASLEEVCSLSSLESITLETATDNHSLLGCVWLLCSAPIQSPTAIAGISRATPPSWILDALDLVEVVWTFNIMSTPPKSILRILWGDHSLCSF